MMAQEAAGLSKINGFFFSTSKVREKKNRFRLMENLGERTLEQIFFPTPDLRQYQE